MAVIVPFRGISYDLKKVGEMGRVVAPPYDVISPEAQEGFYRLHPQNVIRLILNKETPADNPQDNRYTRSAASLKNWLQEGTLVRAPQPLFYFLQEEFDLPPGVAGLSSKKQVRRGFIALVRLEAYGAGVVLPHEKTQNKPKADRLALMEACQANLSQIYSLYTDEEGAMAPIYEKVFASPEGPVIDITDGDGFRHKLWMVSDPPILARVTAIMKSRQIYIADGHHRYETALAYQERQKARFPGNTGKETYNFTMMYLAGMEDPGILILPTHRVVSNLEGFQPAPFLERLRADFAIESFPFPPGKAREAGNRFFQALAARSAKGQAVGMLLKESDQFCLLSLKDEKAWEKAAPGLAPSLKALDVNLLHILILQKLLRIGPPELAAGKNVVYYKEAEEAMAAVQSGPGQAAFFLNGTKVHQVKDVSLAGETMPSKATFFYPKLLSGLVINPLDSHEEIVLE